MTAAQELTKLKIKKGDKRRRDRRQPISGKTGEIIKVIPNERAGS